MEEGQPSWYIGLALVRELDFTSRLHTKSQRSYTRAGSLSRVTCFIFPGNPESEIWVQLFIL